MNSIWLWILIAAFLGMILLAGFVYFARKGRMLRKNQPLPPKAGKAFLKWSQDGKLLTTEISTPFYLGKSAESNIVLAAAKTPYEVCIFYHDKKFAVQTLEGAGELLINGEEVVAAYLWDADELVVARQKFTFHCY